MADVMRLVIEAAPVIIENGISNGGTISTDDNSNNRAPSSQTSAKSATHQFNERWEWNSLLSKEEELNNYKSCNTNKNLQLNCNQEPFKSPQFRPLDLKTGSEENRLETPSPVNSTPSEADSSCCESSDSEEEKPTLARKSFANPNYPGFQHLAHELSDTFNNNNNNLDAEPETPIKSVDNYLGDVEKEIDSVNKLNPEEEPKEIYRRPKLNIPLEEKPMNCDMDVLRRGPGTTPKAVPSSPKLSPTSMKPSPAPTPDLLQKCPVEKPLVNSKLADHKTARTDTDEAEKGEGDTKKREKTELNSSVKTTEKDGFDVYNIETAMPKIDLEAIESHLRAAREEERRRRNDREEIRRRLATGCDGDEYYNSSDKPGKKPSLQARLQSGMNLQICFMNETSSDTESPSSESAPPSRNGTPSTATPTTPKSKTNPEPPKSLNLTSKARDSKCSFSSASASDDFFTRQARLQAEARHALSQAKDRARLQMEADRLSGKTSPITEMLRASLKKVGVHFPPERRRVSRQMLTDMNVAQLQVIVNDLHTQIEILNEGLVKYLMERDELHMTQDSMLVDIEDVTRYLGAKESCLKDDIVRNNNLSPPANTKPVITRIVSMGKK